MEAAIGCTEKCYTAEGEKNADPRQPKVGRVKKSGRSEKRGGDSQAARQCSQRRVGQGDAAAQESRRAAHIAGEREWRLRCEWRGRRVKASGSRPSGRQAEVGAREGSRSRSAARLSREQGVELELSGKRARSAGVLQSDGGEKAEA